jgi:hypothetical protein
MVLSLGLFLGAPSVASSAGFTLQGATRGPPDSSVAGWTEGGNSQESYSGLTWTVGASF